MDKEKIENRLKEIDDEIRLLSEYVGASLEKRLVHHLDGINDLMEKFHETGVSSELPPESLALISNGMLKLKKDLDTLLASFEKDRKKDNDKLFSAFEGGLKKDHDALLSVLEKNRKKDLDTLINAFESDRKKDLDTLIATFDGDRKKDNDTLLSTIDGNRKKDLDTLLASFEKDRKKDLDALITAFENNRKKDNDTLFAAIESGRKKDIESLIERIGKNAGALVEGISSIDAALHASDEGVADRFDSLDTKLEDGIEELKSSSSSLASLLTFNEKESLASMVGKINAGTKKIIAELPDIDVKIGNGLDDVKNSIRDIVTQVEGGTANVREAVLKDIRALSENAEVIRRMCTTDDEKFLGGMTTVIYNHINRMNEELPIVTLNIKNWFVTLDRKVQKAGEDINSRQNEMKKLLLYDLEKIGETSEALKAMCTTTEERPLGSEMLTVSDSVGSILKDVGDIQSKVTNMSEQLDRVSGEVMRMRWFVIAAVAVSIIVLVSSVFL